jgi:hypothetical protein
MLRRAEISSHYGASAGWADARRRDADDAGHRRGAGNAADARPPPRPARRPVLRLAIYYDGRRTIDKPGVQTEVGLIVERPRSG